MASVVVSVPHRLAVPEVRRRITAWLVDGGPGAAVRRWQDDCLRFEVTVAGRPIAGQVVVTGVKVTATSVLPWQFLPFAASVKQQVANDLRTLLDG